MEVGLATDSGSVETRIQIRSDYRALVRKNSVFWPVSSIDVRLGWTGVTVEADSLEAVASGGVGLATPDNPDSIAVGGQRFVLLERAPAGFEEWRPRLPLGPQTAAGSIPRAHRATFSIPRTRWGLTRVWQIPCWLHPLSDGRLLAPAELPGDQPLTAGMTIEVDGTEILLTGESVVVHGKLALLQTANLPGSHNTSQRWETKRLRAPNHPEDCLLFAGGETLPLAASRLQPGPTWAVDPSIDIPPHWLGAAVIARGDGALIGLLIGSNGPGVIAPLTTDVLRPSTHP